jgi:hypothetical protein
MTDEGFAAIRAEDLYYPEDLRAREEAYLARRRPGPQSAPRLGVALSGGGIRSATFCLGIFQALATAGAIRAIDFLSTVSGGGFFGGFLTRLFSRAEFRSAERVEAALVPDANPTSTAGQIQRWLRENGRYLAPQGSGGMLYNLAIVIRNWLATLGTVLVFSLTLFLAFEAVLELVRMGGIGVRGQSGFHLSPAAPVIVSSLVLIPLSILTFLYFPACIAYWGFSSGAGIAKFLAAAVRSIFMAVPAALVSALLWRVFAHQVFVPDWTALFLAILLIQYAATLVMLQRCIGRDDDIGRNRLSRRSHKALVWFLATFVLAVIHCIALNLAEQGMAFVSWVTGALTAVLAPFVLYTPQLARFIQSKPGQTRIKVSKRLVLGTAAIVILGGLAASMGAVAHALFSSGALIGWFALLAGLVVSASLKYQTNFINRCGLLPLYTARLVRAYLGASNRKRFGGAETSLLLTDRDDDMSFDEFRDMYLKPSGTTAADRTAPPIHLVNVTINETVSGRSQVQQQDRKGLGLTVGPFGYSAGAHHHYVLPDVVSAGVQRYPKKYTHYVFARDAPPPEQLSLGQWVGISGAAFNTGTGYRTSLGLSVLTGLFNIRLGYWWNSGQPDKGMRSRWRRVLQAVFPVQISLFDEWTARFKGTVEPPWHLSDGGHFENLGAYELIRRRVPVILIIDSEADPDYAFEGLANLVRKARLDFGAEIDFLTRREIEGLFGKTPPPGPDEPETFRAFGTLDDLRRGRWSGTGDPDTICLEEEGQSGLSRAHATLGRVTYASGAPDSLLVYIKPALTQDAPTDLTEYHRNHCSFPHEPTSDQFFDEAQWESYRKLGKWIMDKVQRELRRTGHAPSPGDFSLLLEKVRGLSRAPNTR